jgi:HNH endonuclease
MTDEIPPELVVKMMVKCARRCCICRRFRPTKLQVHHIRERGQGGTNDEGNLIVVCFSCHTDVHTKVPFARRFSVEELKGHRDALVRMVEEGVFPSTDTDDTDEAVANLVRTLRAGVRPKVDLLPEAVEILVGAVQGTGSGQGDLIVSRSFEGLDIVIGGGDKYLNVRGQREAAAYKHVVEQLVRGGLLERLSDGQFEVTYEGYLAADELMVSRGKVEA